MYIADLQIWLKHVSATTYADDTSTSVSHKLLSKVIKMLEEDADNVLRFMASNGLVANASKTALMFLNLKTNSYNEPQVTPIKIKIGKSYISQESSSKLLGITIDDNQGWISQITGQGGMIPSLNSRLFLIKRLHNSLSKNRLKRIADSLYTSKIRYGVQLLGKVRAEEDEPTQALLNKLQVTQNKFARFMIGKCLLDKIPTKKIFREQNMLSINQINAQSKLSEVWKSLNTPGYPTKWEISKLKTDTRTRSREKQSLIEPGRSKLLTCTFISDAARLWNIAPDSIKNSVS